MKKCFIIAMCLCSTLAFARSPHHRGHRHHRDGDGVWLAAGITGIVAITVFLQCIENLTQSNDFPIMRGYRNLSSPQIICKFDHIYFSNLRELFYSTVQRPDKFWFFDGL